MKKFNFKKIKETWKRISKMNNPIQVGPKITKQSPISNGPTVKTPKSKISERIIRSIKRPRHKITLSSTKGNYGVFSSYPMSRVQKYMYWYKWSWIHFGIDRVPEAVYDQTKLAHDMGIAWGELIWKDCTKIEKFLIKAKLFWHFLRG